MDHRPFYVLGDFLACLVIGAISGLIAWSIVDTGWNMWLAMIAMMALGMIIGMACYFPVASRLGAMEAMIPAMYSGMWGGMVVGMMAAMVDLPVRHAIEMGAACGVGEIVFIWVANRLLRGVTRSQGEA